MTKKIAVVGAGLAGLATCWHLLQFEDVTVDLIDAAGIGKGASGVSTGLLHPFPGKFGLRSWKAEEGMEETQSLIQVAEKTVGRPVATQTGIARIALQEVQAERFQELTKENSDALWIQNVAEKFPGAVPAAGLWIPQGMTIYTKLYLEGLWKACQSKGAQFIQTRIESLDALSSYDGAILAMGPGILQFAECRKLPIEPVKGQALVCRCSPKEIPCALIGNGHISATEDPSICLIGSTYEHCFESSLPDPKRAITELKRKVGSFYPAAEDFEVLDVVSGVRMTRKKGEYRPWVGMIAPGVWVFTGLGSRGALYHALLGKQLAAAVYQGSFLSV